MNDLRVSMLADECAPLSNVDECMQTVTEKAAARHSIKVDYWRATLKPDSMADIMEALN